MAIMEDNISKIKERIDIVDLISGYLKLQKAGINYKANCPFHGEKTPSFYVSPERQIWHCFGCGLGGSAFDFIMQMDGLEFGEALQVLAKRAGIELEKFDRAVTNEKTRLLDITELATRFFKKQLWESKSGQAAVKYLTDRGMSEQSIKEWQLGFAPDAWTGLSEFLTGQGFRDQEIFNAGLNIKRESTSGRSSGYYDRFRSRIIFPVNDLNGQTVGFSGRVFEEAAKAGVTTSTGSLATQSGNVEVVTPAKYINTPQTLIYDKSRVLYGLDKAKGAIRTGDSCLVMEGNVDVIMSHQAGAAQAVASSGTALTDAHLKILKRYTNNLVFCFDQDKAGINATERAITSAIRQDLNVNVVTLDDEINPSTGLRIKDPADYVQKHGAKWAEQAAQTKAIFAFYIESGLKQHDPANPIGKKMIAEKVLPLIKNIRNKIEQSHWLAELALQLKTSELVLRDQLEVTPSEQLAASVPLGRLAEADFADFGLNTLEDCLISLLLLKPDLAKLVGDEPVEQQQALYSAPLMRYIMAFRQYLQPSSTHQASADSSSGGQNGAISYILKQLGEQPGFDPMYLEKLYIQAQEMWKEFDDVHLEREFTLVLGYLRRKHIAAKLAGLELAIKQAERTKDKEIVNGLLTQFQTTAKLLLK